MKEEYEKFIINGKLFLAKGCVDGILINPKLPQKFDSTSNDFRPASHQKFWHSPYITTFSMADWEEFFRGATDEYANDRRAEWDREGRQNWLRAWPSGIRYEVRCLDGGAWDRSTSWGMFATIEEALECTRSGPAWRSHAMA